MKVFMSFPREFLSDQTHVFFASNKNSLFSVDYGFNQFPLDFCAVGEMMMLSNRQICHIRGTGGCSRLARILIGDYFNAFERLFYSRTGLGKYVLPS